MAKHGTKTTGPARGGRVSEAVPEDEVPSESVYSVTMADRGRVVLPVEVRDRLHIGEGDALALVVKADGTITLKTRDVVVKNLRGMFKHLARPGRLASDELIAERRREARMEERELAASLAPARRRVAR